jgi:hypothetical protein
MSTNSPAAVPFSGNIPPEVLADAEAVALAVSEGRKVDPDVARRVQERAAKARQEILATHGVQNIGVDIIRELRGELPAQ